MQERASEAVEREAGTVRHDLFLGHTPERVWVALTSPADLAEWMMAESALVEPRVGGRVDIDTVFHIQGSVLAWEPPFVLEYDFQVVRPAGLAHDGSVVRYELRPEGEGTRLTLTFHRLSPELTKIFVRGRALFTDRLDAYLRGAPMPEPGARAALDAAKGDA